jgi:hypothetical protein
MSCRGFVVRKMRLTRGLVRVGFVLSELVNEGHLCGGLVLVATETGDWSARYLGRVTLGGVDGRFLYDPAMMDLLIETAGITADS